MRIYIVFLFLVHALSAQSGTENWQEKNVKSFFLLNQKNKETLFYALGQTVQVHFDLLASSGDLGYKILHCSPDWTDCKPPALWQIEGFSENTLPLSQQYFSENTRQAYVHFHFELPNNQSKSFKSGHYILQIYQEKTEEIIAQKRFAYYNQEIPLKISLQEQFSTENWQNVLHIKGTQTKRKLQNQLIKVGVLVNQNWDFFSLLQPIVQNTEQSLLFYFRNGENVFEKQGFTFHLTLDKVDQYSINRQKIALINGLWHYYLRNSDWIFNNNNAPNNAYQPVNIPPSLSSDYVQLIIPSPLPAQEDETTYLYSSWTNYQKTPETAFEVLLENGAYSVTTLLKQGQYPYWLINCKTQDLTDCYFLYPKKQAGIDDRYEVILYYNDPLEQNYSIIGFGNNVLE